MRKRKRSAHALVLFIFVLALAAALKAGSVFADTISGTITATTAVGGVSFQPIQPLRLIIPSIHLDDPIQGVGQTSNGEMGVPDGSTDNVGWYEYGTVPGQLGSAVLDAHVFAAFSNLKYLKPGSDVYVLMSNDQELHFVVAYAQNYALDSLSPASVFDQADTERLNLITCAGQLTPDHSTYNERLVVYTVLAGVINMQV